MSLDQVREFHLAFGHPVEEEVTTISKDRMNLRLGLIKEELEETIEALEASDLIKFVDGLSDMTVVINGTILEFGGYRNIIDEQPYRLPENDPPRLPSESTFEAWVKDTKHHIDRVEHEYGEGNIDMVLSLLEVLSFDVINISHVNRIPIIEINEVVHKANMSKLGEDGKPIYRESDNKILKGPNFQPPEEDIARILKEHGAEL